MSDAPTVPHEGAMTHATGPDIDALRLLPPRALRALLADGLPVPDGHLDDHAFLGVSLGIPHWVERLAWTTFLKCFLRDPDTGRLRGWNVRLRQTGLAGPVEPLRRRDGEPFSFGHFRVLSAQGYAGPAGTGAGLMLDYGLGGNAPLDPVRLLRDPLVRLRGSDLLLGWSYLDLGIAIATPSYFALRRQGPLDHTATPARRPAAGA